MPFDRDTTWRQLVHTATVGSRTLLYGLIEGKECYDAWEVFRDGRNDNQLKNDLGKTLSEVREYRRTMENFQEMWDGATNGVIVTADRFSEWRKFFPPF